MQLSTRGLNFIKSEEGLRLNVYRDSVGVLTIGYGHTGKDVVPGLVITEQQAERLLLADTGTAQDAVNRLVKVALTPGQFDALVSFVFNVGVGAFERSTLLKVVNTNPADTAIVTQFRRWVFGTKSGVKIALPGLVKRRTRESILYFT